MATVAALVTDFDGRMSDADRAPVWEKKITFVTLSAESLEGTIALSLNGLLQKIILVFPATTTTGRTGTLTIDDNFDFEVFSSGAKDENGNYVYNLSEPLSGKVDISFKLNDTPGGDHTAKVYLRGI